jgi:cell division protease FtsH
LIAKAIASECDANFISVASSEFVELFVGLGAQKVRSLFKEARENTPCILFIDEIDSIGKQRGTGINMGNDEREQTLNQLLAEMDGFNDNTGVLVIAATNRRDVLDSALLRPGRFDRLINVPLPDKESRKKIFQVHTKNKQLAKSIEYEFLAELSAGFSGAQIKNLVNEAAIFAARKGAVEINQNDLEYALEKMVVGIAKRNDTRSENTRTRVALHEAGHAVLSLLFPEYFELKKVTIQATYNGAGGYTLFNEKPEITESGLYTKECLKKRLVVAMGGKAAETLFYGEDFVSLGAVQDLKTANQLAQSMIGNYGMGDKLQVFFNENTESGRNPFLGRSLGMGDKYSERTKEMMDKESLQLVNDAYQEAYELLESNKKSVAKLAKLLVDNETVKNDLIEAMFVMRNEEE